MVRPKRLSKKQPTRYSNRWVKASKTRDPQRTSALSSQETSKGNRVDKDAQETGSECSKASSPLASSDTPSPVGTPKSVSVACNALGQETGDEISGQELSCQSTELNSNLNTEWMQELSGQEPSCPSTELNSNLGTDSTQDLSGQDLSCQSADSNSNPGTKGTQELSRQEPSLEVKQEFFQQDEDGDTYLHIAVVQGNHALVQYLTTAMRHVTLDIYNKLRQTPLHLAVITRQAGLVRHLIESGADVNLLDRHGQTALHLACQLGDVDCVTAVRHATSGHEDRLNLDITNSQGLCAIHVATLSGDRELIGLVLDMGADINSKDANSGRTSLHHAVESGRSHVVAYLLSRGARVNENTFSGNTPLHTAAGREMENMVALLAQHGADVNLPNMEGDVPRVFRGGSELGKRQLESSRKASKQQKKLKTSVQRKPLSK